MAVAAVMRTCGRFPSFQTLPKLGKMGSLHQKICPNSGRYSCSRLARAIGPIHHIPCAYRTLGVIKRSFFSVSLPNWGKRDICEDFPTRQHSNTVIIKSFSYDRLAKWAHLEKVPYTQLKLRADAMGDFTSAGKLRNYLSTASKEYQSFDFQTFSEYSNGKKPFIIVYSTPADLLLVSPLNYGLEGDDPQVAICLNIPLDPKHINTAVNIIERFNNKYPFSLGLNK